jgi:hypothetical protein
VYINVRQVFFCTFSVLFVRNGDSSNGHLDRQDRFGEVPGAQVQLTDPLLDGQRSEDQVSGVVQLGSVFSRVLGPVLEVLEIFSTKKMLKKIGFQQSPGASVRNVRNIFDPKNAEENWRL